MSNRNPEVLVVGGSTVGLLTAVFLARAGVPTLVAERRAEPPAHPRAMGVGPRTVELLRAAGMADAVDAVCMDMSRGGLRNFSTPTLAEADLAALSEAAPARDDGFGELTPQTLRGTCPQGRLDRVAIERATASGARTAFGTELLTFEQDDEGVTCRLAGPDGPFEVRPRYLVAADGARSGVRRALGIGTTGPGDLGDPLISVLFHADLDDLTGGWPFVVCDITTPEAPGGLLPVDGVREWIYHTRYSSAAGQSAADFTPERCRALIRAALGRPDVPVEVRGILPWQVRGALADRFRHGRVLLAGDAAHVIPPVGAFGMNTGAADAHNLAWKLAHVLAGHAGDTLLDTYEAERLPVARTALEQSMLRLEDPSLHWGTGPEGRTHRAAAGALNAPVVHLGYRYDSAGIQGAVPRLPSTEDVVLNLDGSPGSRLPHRWLLREGARVSTLDLVDYRFTLLAGAEGEPWLRALERVAPKLGIPVDAHLVGDGRLSAEDGGSWTDSVGIGASGALLVRPDGFVGRRVPALSADPEAELEEALTGLLGLAGQGS
ncbi:FAD-dependent monooxygenase [Streptomyces albidoflavus]|uniref:FAD-dependent monooxygenase n=1 Tax=Streptomyces albidoflavus TaxID=1886 RepID=UPI00101E7E49|nr:FAD-dependent monooxygenase [Streptomyces albidoflavus]RZD87870.1 2,4-dichlorophenol 6-monooxygenase [Streptomyces albidoflavus]RZE03345.1 2,4-dichlorophenol 6-monooxygenase [Streptomyces albidoflavus]RZE11797.1 2,4-dichlorophenol 6-monooxygenase [Streptomyces albidoflavus]